MDIRKPASLKATAAQRLEAAPQHRQISLIYAGMTVACAALITIVNYILDLRIDQTGGLSNMSTRTLLTTLRTMLPLALSMFLLCLDVGYFSAMLRISREQYASPHSLRAGFERFWPLLRYTVFQGLIFFSLMFAAAYFSVQIFLLTPLSRGTMEILMPLTQETGTVDPNAIADMPIYAELMESMVPVLIMTAVLYAALCIPVVYQYRMTHYVILDKPGLGALNAMRESRKMMRRNRFKLFRVDVSLLLYHGLCFLASLLCYGEELLPMIGISLPFPEAVSYFLFYALFLAAEFGIYYFLRSRAEVTYALFYEAIKPQPPKSEGIVLGNIFQM